MFSRFVAPYMSISSALHKSNTFASATNYTTITEPLVGQWRWHCTWDISFVSSSLLLFFPSLHPSVYVYPPFPTLTCVTTNSELNCISSLHITHFQSRPCVSKWKLHVSMEKCWRASQHTTSQHYSNYGFSCPTKCTGTTEYLYCILNVCYVFRH